MKTFKISDLAAKKISAKEMGGFGEVGKVAPGTDITDFSPLSPWIMLSKIKGRIDFIEGLGDRVEKIKLEKLDQVALDVGRGVLASKFFPGTALCSIDMPTCARNERISPIASITDTVTSLDVAMLRNELSEMLERIDALEKQ